MAYLGKEPWSVVGGSCQSSIEGRLFYQTSNWLHVKISAINDNPDHYKKHLKAQQQTRIKLFTKSSKHIHNLIRLDINHILISFDSTNGRLLTITN